MDYYDFENRLEHEGVVAMASAVLSHLATFGEEEVEKAWRKRYEPRIKDWLSKTPGVVETLQLFVEYQRGLLSNLTVDICNALGMKGAAIRLLDSGSGELKLVASYGLSDEFLNKGPVSATTSDTQALKGETLVIEDATKDDRIQYKKEMKKEGIVSMIVTPIKSRDEIIGVLRLYANVKREFPEDFITVVQALAHQGALAIQNATMYLTLQKDKQDLEEDIWSHRSWF